METDKAHTAASEKKKGTFYFFEQPARKK